jgi:hypothetical protein
MSDYISREAAFDAVRKIHNPNTARAVMSVVALREIPAADVVEVVRCKDCKWSDWYSTKDGKRYCYCMETGIGGRTEDDYCSYAEREDGADNG